VQAQLLDNQTVRLTGLNVSDTAVPISYTVTDGDGDVASGQFSAAVRADLTANSFTSPTPATVRRTGTAGASLSIDLMTQIIRVEGQALEFFVSNGAGIVGSDGIRGTVSVGLDNGAVTYTPPSGTMSQFNTGSSVVVLTSGGAALHDTFSYTVRYRDDPTTMATGTVTVPIQGSAASNASFQSLYTDDLAVNCTGACHEAAGTAPNWFGAAAKATFCNLRSGSDSVAAPNSLNAYVNRGAPAQSAIYLKPDGQLGHGGGNLGIPLVRARILNWISEGAWFTNGADQDCP
jgi:hypothetical protein